MTSYISKNCGDNEDAATKWFKEVCEDAGETICTFAQNTQFPSSLYMQSILTQHPQPAPTPPPPLPQPPAPAPPRLRPLLRLVCCPARAATPTPTPPTPPPQSPALPLSQPASRALLLPLAPATARTLTMAQSSPPLAPQARPQPATQAHPRLALLAAPRAVLHPRVLLRAWAWSSLVLLRSVLLAPCLLCKMSTLGRLFRDNLLRRKKPLPICWVRELFHTRTHLTSFRQGGELLLQHTGYNCIGAVDKFGVSKPRHDQDMYGLITECLLAQNGRHYSAFSVLTIDKHVTQQCLKTPPMPACTLPHPFELITRSSTHIRRGATRRWQPAISLFSDKPRAETCMASSPSASSLVLRNRRRVLLDGGILS